jgi:hypothetical protein
MIPQAEVLDDAPAVRWSLAERVGLRFAFAIALLSLPQLLATFRYSIAPDGTVTLDGTIGDDPVTMHLRRVDPRKFPLLSQP